MSRKQRKFDTMNETDENKICEIGKRKKFHPHDLKSLTPKNDRQRDFLQAYYSQIPLIIQGGCAGTGKSTMAMYAAFSEVFDTATPYDRLILVRSSVATREIGFLPGDVDEKQAPFEAPYRAIAKDILNYNDPYDNLKALGYYEFYLSSHLRGLTFDNAVIVIDEVQNMIRQELLTVLTRCGINSRIVICGDSKQDDVTGIRYQVSAWDYLMQLINNMPSSRSAMITYGIDDCLRGGIVKDILAADYHIPENSR